MWSDCLHVVEGVGAIQNGELLQEHADADLWALLASLLAQLDAAAFQVRHTPSHLDTRLTTSPFEDWLACHNGHADTLATFANSNRSQQLLDVYQAALRYHTDMLQILRALRGIYFGIADFTANRSGHPLTGAEFLDSDEATRPLAVPRRCDLETLLPVGWTQLVSAGGTNLPRDFILTLCRFVFVQDSQADSAFTVTWLELVFMLESIEGFVYPVSGPGGGWLSPASVTFLPPPPTVAGRLTLVRRALRHAFKCLRLQCLFISGVDRTELGIGFSLDGLVIGADVQLLLRARAALGHFAQGRRMQSRAALARPI